MPTPGYNDADWKAAGITDEGSFTPTQVFTAEDDIKTFPALVLTGQDLDVFQLVAFNAANKVVPWDPTQTDSRAICIGAMAMAINTTSPAGDRQAEVYEGGCFNPDVLGWPASLDTWLERNAALRAARAPIRVKRLL
jgi:hypothetical protein